jgi:hypothetical protein
MRRGRVCATQMSKLPHAGIECPTQGMKAISKYQGLLKQRRWRGNSHLGLPSKAIFCHPRLGGKRLP